MDQKHSKNIYHMSVTVNLTVKDVIQIKLGIKINKHVSVKIQEKVYARKILFGILLHEVMKMVDMQKALLAIQ